MTPDRPPRSPAVPDGSAGTPAALLRRSSGVTDVVSVVLLLVAAAVLWWQPMRVYRCARQGGGLARCVVADRLLGLVPLRERAIDGIEQALYGARVEVSQSERGGGTGGGAREIRTRVEALTLLDARQRVLWSASGRHLLGTSLEALASRIEALRRGEEPAPFALWYAPRPPWLLASLFALLGASHLSVRIGLALIGRGLLPRSLYHAAYWGPTLALLALLAAAWLVALAGARPPAWLAASASDDHPGAASCYGKDGVA